MLARNRSRDLARIARSLSRSNGACYLQSEFDVSLICFDKRGTNRERIIINYLKEKTEKNFPHAKHPVPLLYLMIMAFSTEKLSVGRPAIFQALIFTGSPRVLVREKSEEHVIFMSLTIFNQA